MQKHGRKPLTCSIHWIEGTSTLPLDVLTWYLGWVLHGLEPDANWLTNGRTGRQGYNYTLNGPDGLSVWYSLGRRDIHFVFPGDCCDQASIGRLLELCQLEQTKLTRVDLALDGVVGPDGLALDPHFIYQLACDNGGEQIRTRAKLKFDESLALEERPDSRRFLDGTRGSTCYVGSRYSDRMLRVYNGRGFCRMEIEVKGDKAQELQLLLRPDYEHKLAAIVVGVIRGFTDFIKPGYGAGNNKSKAPLQGWWKDVVDNTDKIQLSVAQPDPEITRMWKWLKHISANYSTAVKAAGGDIGTVMDKLLSAGEQKMSGRHEQILKTAALQAWSPT